LLPKLRQLADEENYAACSRLKKHIDTLCALQKESEQRLSDLATGVESTSHIDIIVAVDQVLHSEKMCPRGCTSCKENRQRVWNAVKPHSLPLLVVLLATLVVACRNITQPPPEPSWTDIIGAPHFMAEGQMLLKKRSGQSREWDSGASSVQQLERSSWREQGVVWTAATTSKVYMIGLNSKDLHREDQVHFALLCRKDGSISVVEKEHPSDSEDRDEITPVGGRMGYKEGDQLAVKVKGVAVTYYLNGKLIYTSKRRPVFPLVVDAEFRDTGARADGVRLL
jgi:hypothetical protein